MKYDGFAERRSPKGSNEKKKITSWELYNTARTWEITNIKEALTLPTTQKKKKKKTQAKKRTLCNPRKEFNEQVRRGKTAGQS